MSGPACLNNNRPAPKKAQISQSTNSLQLGCWHSIRAQDKGMAIGAPASVEAVVKILLGMRRGR